MAPAAMKEWSLSYSVEARTGDWQPEPGQNADLVLVRVSGATHAMLALNLARSLRLSWSLIFALPQVGTSIESPYTIITAVILST